MVKILNFTDLYAWQEGHKLALETYKITEKFPKSETFGLTSQMRRAAVSVTSNIAEGFSRQSYKEKVQFYSISLGSITELHNQLLIAKDVGLLTESKYKEVIEQLVKVHKITMGLTKKSKTFT